MQLSKTNNEKEHLQGLVNWTTFCITKRFASLHLHRRLWRHVTNHEFDPFLQLSSLIDLFSSSTRAARARGCALAGCWLFVSSLFCRMTTRDKQGWRHSESSIRSLCSFGWVFCCCETPVIRFYPLHTSHRRGVYWLLRPNVGDIAFGVFGPHKTLNSCCCAFGLCMVS